MYIAIDSIRGVKIGNRRTVQPMIPTFCVFECCRESASGISAATLPSSFRGRSHAFDNGATPVRWLILIYA